MEKRSFGKLALDVAYYPSSEFQTDGEQPREFAVRL